MVRWERLVLATDFSSDSEAALRTAARIAKGCAGEVLALHVVAPPPAFETPQLQRVGRVELAGEWVEAPRRRMARLVGRLRRRGIEARGYLRVGRPWREIVRFAYEAGAEGICVGRSGHSRVERLLLGSTAENVVRNASVPVLATRERPLRRVRRVLLPVDFEEGSRAAVRYALERFPEATRLDALYVEPLNPLFTDEAVVTPREEVEEEVRTFLDDAGAGRAVVEVALFADPAERILRAAAAGVDLALLATHGRRGIARWFLGSVSEKVVRYAACPVLVLPGPGRASGAPGVPPPAETLEGEVDGGPLPVEALTPGRIPRRRWRAALDEFSDRNVGWLTLMEVDALDIGAQRAVELPLLGLVYDDRADALEISFTDFRRVEDHVSHTVARPSEIELWSAAEREVLRIAHEGGQTLIQIARSGAA